MHATGNPKADEKLPAAQEAHVADVLAPEAVENCPVEHNPVHATGSPRADEKLPAAQ